MNINEYLKSVLTSQELAEDGNKLTALREHFEEVKSFLLETFADSSPNILRGGSYVKKTLIKESYDLDIACRFSRDDTNAGETLEELYSNVGKALREKYVVQEKPSALRIKSLDALDFHIDVVPSRFIDESSTDVFLYRNLPDESRLKTNLEVHIEHISESKLRKIIRLVKLWRVRNGLQIRTFPLELLVIKILNESQNKEQLDERLIEFWQEVRDNIENITIEDPANPCGNDLTPIFDESIKENLRWVAERTLKLIEDDGWEGVFGKVETVSDEERRARVLGAAAGYASAPKPWCSK